jgi:hypothetical protein
LHEKIGAIVRESVEFRIPEELAAEYLPDDVGKRLGDEMFGYSVRKVVVPTDSPLYIKIGKLHREFTARGEDFFYGRNYIRRYSDLEIEEAKWLQAIVTRYFEPSGEECGTLYDTSRACPHCGAGAPQLTELKLDLRRVPRGDGFASTIADEIVLSQRAAELLVEAGLTGFELRRVEHKARYKDDAIDPRRLAAGRELIREAESEGAPYDSWKFSVWLNRSENQEKWNRVISEYSDKMESRRRIRGRSERVLYQLLVDSRKVEINPRTRAGSDPFDEEAFGMCPNGDVIGLNLLSEVWIDRSSLSASDFLITRQMVGIRSGVLRPRPILLISQKARKAIAEAKLKGIKVEVVHVV